MISRSEYGARCQNCLQLNPASVLPGPAGELKCIHCTKPFRYWTEKLPFYCTGGQPGAEAPDA